MSSSSKKRQTMAKITRERLVKERRALKQEKKEEKKQAAAAARDAEAAGIPMETIDEDGSGAGLEPASSELDEARVARPDLHGTT